MRIAMIGMGKMGSNMTTRLLNGGHEVMAFDLNEAAVARAESAGALGARTLDALVEKLPPPRTVWVMVPAGAPHRAHPRSARRTPRPRRPRH